MNDSDAVEYLLQSDDPKTRNAAKVLGAKVDAANAKIAALEGALRPFAKFAESANGRHGLIYGIRSITASTGKIIEGELTFEYCESARAALAGVEPARE